MFKRFALAGFAATILVAAATLATSAAAGNVAWGVTVGGPGFALSAAQPAYGGWGGPYYRAVAPAPYAGLTVGAPVVYPYIAPYVAAVARPYYYPRFHPYSYPRAWHGPASVHYARGHYGWR
jgi:hypothetical protein